VRGTTHAGWSREVVAIPAADGLHCAVCVGRVRLGINEKTGERVALKILKMQDKTVTADVKKQVEREIHAMSQIQHVNVIRLKEVQWDATYEKKNGQKVRLTLCGTV